MIRATIYDHVIGGIIIVLVASFLLGITTNVIVAQYMVGEA